MANNSTSKRTSRRRSVSQDRESTSPHAKKPMFSIFQKGSNAPSAPADIAWKTHGSSFIVGQAFHPKSGSKVASFDLDSTLIKVNGKHKWPKNADDWVWWVPGVPAHLQKVADEGYTLVVITNQGGLDGNVDKQDEMKLKFEKICGRLKLPMWILISMRKDHNRKPMTGLWHWLELKFLEDDVAIDLAESYYVGDAAGRVDGWKVGATKDFNNTDRKFADSLGLPFHTPEHFFLDQACPDHKWSYGGFDPKKWPTNVPLFSPTSTPLLPPSGTSELILFCGYPASGKSSFASKHILSTGQYEYVNQDTLKTKDKCLKAVDEGLKNKKAVVVDNTNPDVAARAPYIALAKKYNVPVRCFLFQADKDLATHNNYFRAFHRPLIAAASEVLSKAASSAEAMTMTTTTTTTTTSTTTTTTAVKSSAHGDQSTSVTSTKTDKAVKVTKVRDEPVRERLSEMVFATFAKKYQEPTLKEGFTEIKKVNFIPDEDIRATWERWYF
ncbi:PNK3P-domain-containing protein [Linnemannia elongata AG-77]|uniref:PNK3P-domain-containing protein n=1 Tax=Linnemannia elongata AG-77 TaxID=1314771 RepID=A0A197JUE2_9FUNG|nr:PNK3P-domain-containing protein [Linnemannia elongata AG-77]